jgi:transposase-like protein
LIGILEDRMVAALDRHLAAMAELDEADRRNGSYGRHLLTELDSIELSVPRSRTFSAGAVLHAYSRRVDEVDRMILACFVLRVSTRKVGAACCPCSANRSAPRR